MKATSLPSSTVDRSTGEDNIIVQNIVYANSDSGLLFIMCGHYSPLVVWYNYLAWHISMNEIVKGKLTCHNFFKLILKIHISI